MNRRQEVSSFWEGLPPRIQSMLLSHHAEELDLLERAEVLSYLPSFQNKTVLDLGAGIGRFTAEFAKEAKSVVSLELCSHFVEVNRINNGAFSNIEWICSDALDATFGPKQFDLIFISWLFMYLTNEEIQTLSEKLKLWLKPTGALFFRESCAAVSHFSETDGYYAHYRSMRDYELMFKTWRAVQRGNIYAYENLRADPFKCYWLYGLD